MRSCCLSTMDVAHILQRQKPHAMAAIHGLDSYQTISGHVFFYDTCAGTLVTATISGLPKTDTNIFAIHIHSGENCQSPDGHFDTDHCSNPNHTGDLPPLFSNNGCAWSAVVTARFRTCDTIGKTVIIHLRSDDFTTQSSGNSGEMIGCGEIRSV